MSSSPPPTPAEGGDDNRKRKREAVEGELEIDLGAPEPPSKKALRKAKKQKTSKPEDADKGGTNESAKVNGADQGKRSDYGIWIGNLSFSTTKQDLIDFMDKDTEYSISEEKISRINLPAGPVKFGKFQNKGFAYIDLVDAEALKSALQLSEKLLAGRRVLIKDAKNFEGRPKETSKENAGHPPSKRVFIGNLDFDTTIESLEKHFGVCGPIHHTQMATFEDSGKCKGYAWIDFEQLPSGQAAMRGWVEEGSTSENEPMKRSKQRIWLHKLNGRKLRVEFAEDKTTRYNKRYGKNAPSDRLNDTKPAIEEVEDRENDTKGMSHNARTRQPNSVAGQRPKYAGKGTKQRYADETVRRLTGAIVEGQGQKVSFD